MALIKWYDISNAGDCLEDAATWNDMIDYIKHSACTDFTIHKICPDTGQAFRFTYDGIFSHIYGGGNSGEDLMITANDGEARSRITLFGGGNIHLDSGIDIFFKENGVEKFKFYDGKSIDFSGDRAIHVDDDETYLGYLAGDSITTGQYNTFIGKTAGRDTTSGDRNTVVGVWAFQVNTIGERNTVFGLDAMNVNLSGNRNAAFGMDALYLNQSGCSNVACGYGALWDNLTTHNNTALGYMAGENALNTACVYLGFKAGQNNATDNVLFINNSNSTHPLIWGDFANDLIKFGNNNNRWLFQFRWDAGSWASVLEGYDQTTANVIIKANSIDTYPLINIGHNNDIMFQVDTGEVVKYYDAANEFLNIYMSTDAIIETKQTNQHLYLKPHGTGLVKFGTYNAGAATDSIGYVSIKDNGGTTRKLMVQA